jgi:signal transduction histidine kinase
VGLRLRILLLILFVIVFALGLTLYTALEGYHHQKAELEKATLRLATSISLQEEQIIAGTRQFIITLSHLPKLSDRDQPACNGLLSRLLKECFPRYSNLGVVKPDGEVFCSALPIRGPVNVAHRAYFQRTLETSDFAIGDYQMDDIAGEPTINFGYPILDKTGRVQGVVYAGIDLTWLSRFSAEAKKDFPEGSTFTTIAPDGAIIAHQPAGQPTEIPFLKVILTRRHGVIDAFGQDGIPRLYAFAPVQNQMLRKDLYLVVGMPKETAFADVNRVLTRNLIWIGVITALTLAAAWVGSGLFILRSVNALMKATRRLTTGDLSTRSGLSYGRDEIGKLARAYDKMAEALEQQETKRKKAEEALKESEERYRTLFEQSPISVWEEDLSAIKALLDNLRASGVNDFRRYFENRPEQVVHCLSLAKILSINMATLALYEARSKDEFLSNLGRIDGEGTYGSHSESIVAIAEGKTSFEGEVTNYTLTGERIDLLIKWIAVPGHEDTYSKVLVSVTDITDRKRVEQEIRDLLRSVKEQREELRALTARLAGVEETERRRLARELHDRVGQGLTVLGINLNIIRSQLSDKSVGKIGDRLEDSLRLLEETAEGIRNVMVDLRPPVLDDYGLLAALRWYGERFSHWTGLVTSVKGEELMPRPSPEVEMALFRIAQEALTNVVRHARAREVVVTLETIGGGARLTIADDGIGFEMGTLQGKGRRAGWGLVTIRERAVAIGGRLVLQSAPGKGTRVIIEVVR